MIKTKCLIDGWKIMIHKEEHVYLISDQTEVSPDLQMHYTHLFLHNCDVNRLQRDVLKYQ